jgi:hypothetical protein
MNKSPGKGNRAGHGFRIFGAGEPPPGGPEKKPSPPLLLVLLNWSSLVSLLFCLLNIFLYGLGLIRDFSGPSLLAFVRMAVYGGIVLAILSLYRFAAGLWFSLRLRRPLSLLISLGFLFLGALGALLAAAGTFIAALAEGNIK